MAKNGRVSDLGLVEQLELGYSVADVSKKTGIPERTIYRRLQEPACRDLRAKLRAARVEHTVALLANVATEAVTTLFNLCKNAKGEMVRLNGATWILRLKKEYYSEVRLIEEVRLLRKEVEESRHGKSSASLGSDKVASARGKRSFSNGQCGSGGDPRGPDPDVSDAGTDPGFLAEKVAAFEFP